MRLGQAGGRESRRRKTAHADLRNKNAHCELKAKEKSTRNPPSLASGWEVPFTHAGSQPLKAEVRYGGPCTPNTRSPVRRSAMVSEVARVFTGW